MDIFFEEISRLERWIEERLPDHSFDAKEIEAGINELNKAYGFDSTLDMMLKANPAETQQSILEWSYYQFYHKVSYLSSVNAYQRRYSEILRRK